MVLALGAVICLPGVASANTIYLAFDTVANGEFTTIVTPTSGPGGQSVATGNYEVYLSTSSTGTPSVLVSGYCFSPQPANTSFTAYNLVPITTTAQEEAAWIVSQGFGGGTIPGASPTATYAEAAQIAVWELIGWSDFSLVSPTDTALTNEVSAIQSAALTAVTGGFNGSGYELAESVNNQYQDFIVPAPLPPTALLLGTGLLGMALLGFRRKRTAFQL